MQRWGCFNLYTALQSQKAVAAYFSNKQLTIFVFAER